jgi:phenylpropionate dioxygenase-like ring-hydroxylating dioxygenase large terminal subunit
MLSVEENELITRVGRGTLMGNFMREYWTPALLASELPTADSDPVRVRLLGEDLIAFRDSHNVVGLIQNNCPHRGASLFFGRNEEGGLRCVYHGWKFDAEGTCVDMPNEPAESDFKHKVKALAYPTRERGGVIWAYLGTRATPPPLPSIEANLLPESESLVRVVMRECNWLQALEGDIDTSHFGFLHAGSFGLSDVPPGTFSQYIVNDRAPKYAVLVTDYGTMYGAYRPAGDDSSYWRIAHYAMPYWTYTPPGPLGNKVAAGAWVPIDDTHTQFFIFARASASGAGRAGTARLFADYLPRDSSPFGRFRVQHSRTDDYGLDRSVQRANRGPDGFTGIPGVFLQDQAVTETMGGIFDRSKEHLATADAMIIQTRRRMLDAARAFAETGVAPNVDEPDLWLQRSGGVVLPRSAHFEEATRELRRAFSNHPEVDPAIVGSIPAA